MKRDLRSEDGVTLVEMLITVVIMSMIIGAVAASFVTAFNSAPPTSERLRTSNAAQVIAGFLVRDAQSAGGTDPFSGKPDDSISVSKTDAASCNPDPSLVIRFSWIDRVPGASAVKRVANYYFDSSANAIVRKTCGTDGSASSLTLGKDIASVSARCNPGGTACSQNLPDTVTLDVTSVTPVSGAPAPAYSYSLTASLRVEGQTAPTDTTASPIPFMTLGGVGCNHGATGLSISGTPDVSIYGQIAVNTTDDPPCEAMNFNGNFPYSSGAIGVLSPGTCVGCPPGSASSYTTPYIDPFAAVYGPLASSCGASGSNPTPGGGGYAAGGSPLVFPNRLNVSGTANFQAGTYVFCNGIDTSNAALTTPVAPAPGVVFYIVNGGWNSGNGNVTVNGLVYAPTSVIDISGNGSFSATMIVAGAIAIHGGSPTVTIGTPPATLISITGPATLPNWTVNRVYPSQTMTATGGGTTYSWSATGLPANLSINAASGVISGTPTVTGSFAVLVSVVDELGDTASQPYTININAAPSITGPATLTDWTINRDYPGTAIIATAGTTAYQWSATGLPDGLSINSATGVVSSASGLGPTATGTFTPTITLTDAAGATTTRGYTIVINATPAITGPATLPDWTAGQVYPNQTMTRVNGTTPYTWAASGLPTGLAINAGSGVISGTPNAAGAFAVSVTLRDKAGASDTRNYNVTINPAPGIATGSLPTAEINRPYNFTITPTAGGTPPYTWSLINPSPAWLSIGASTGTLTGTPPSTGTQNVTVKLTDFAGATTQKTYDLTIAAALQISGPATLPNWTINRDYPGTAIIVTGGVASFTWSATGLPAGLSIDTNTGVISGTPTSTGTSSIVVTVADAYGSTTKNYTVTINAAPSITESSPLPNGEQSVAYSRTIARANGTPNYMWAASGLPNGLSIDAGTGVLSGTPTVFGTFSITFTVTDAAGASASKILSLTLATAPAIDAGTLPEGTVGVAYNAQITGSGGTGPYTFTASGALPAGLSLATNAAGDTGVISGTPTAAGTRAFSVTMRDALNATSTQNYSITINAAPSITTASLPSWTVGIAYPNTTMSKSGGTGSSSWSGTGLPDGLSINSSSGVISGTPTVTGSFPAVAITLTDSLGATVTRTYSITINTPPTITSTSLPDGERTIAYNTTPATSGGTAPFTWSATGLPGGLSIVAGTGVISGTPTVSGSFSVNVTLTDTAGSTTSAALPITLYPQLTLGAKSDCQVQKSPTPITSFSLTATGGNGVYSWSATGLPAGLSISSTTGVISGTTSDNQTNVTVTVNDSLGATANVTFNVKPSSSPSPVC
jgi:type II secretory pathway component PulJ